MKLSRLLQTLVDYQPRDHVSRHARLAEVGTLQTRRLEERRVLAAPTLASGGNAAQFTEDGAAVVVDSGILVADPDSANLLGATIQITGNLMTNDTLLFTNQGGINGAYNSVTGTLTLIGSASVAQYQTALQSITFRNTSNAPGGGTRTVSFTVTDGTDASNVATNDIVVTATSDTPTISDTSTAEDIQSTTGLVITLNPVDGPETTHYKVTNIINGTVYLNDGVTVVAEGGFVTVADGAAGLRFTADADYYGTASITVQASTSASDAGLGGSTAQANISVSPVADDPIVMNATTDEDVAVTGLQVLKNPVDGASVTHFQITNITNGTLAFLNGGNYVDISDGGFVSVARAMNLRFTPASGFNGIGSFDAQSSRNNNVSGLGGTPQTTTVTVTAVNDAPTLTAPGAQSIAEDSVPLVFTAGRLISVSDDATSGTLIVDIMTTSGNFKLNSAAVGNVTFLAGTTDDSKHLRFEGTLAQINAALNGATYDSDVNFTGLDSIDIVVDDQGNTGGGAGLTDSASIAVTVTAVNDAPALTVPGPITIDEDSTPFSFSGADLISVADDATSGNLIVEISATHGRISLNAAAVGNVTFLNSTANNSKLLRFRGTLAQINAALDGATYDSDLNFNGADSIEIEVNDQGNTGTGGSLLDSDSIGVTVTAVNDAPVITAPVSRMVAEDATLTFSGGQSISVADADDSGGSQQLEITITATNGTFSLSQVTGLTLMSGAFDSDLMVFRGSRSDINAALAGATFQPTADFVGAASVNINADDLGNTGGTALTDNETVAITVTAVNDAPIISSPGATQNVDEDATGGLIFSSVDGNQISVADDATSGQLIVKLTATNGTVTLQGDLSGLTFLNATLNGSSVVEFRGSLAQINTALSTVRYDPALNYNGAATITVDVNDQGNTGSGGSLLDTATINIVVAATNDAPVITVPGLQTINEDASPVSFSGGNAISIDDDATSGTLIVEISATNGTIQLNPAATGVLTFLGGTTDGSKLLRFEGTLAQINAALAGATYDSDQDYFGADGISITVDDQGNTGSGGALSDLKVIAVTINPVNDAPVVRADLTQFVNEGQIITFAGLNAIAIEDVDSVNLSVTIDVAATAPAAGARFQLGGLPPGLTVNGNGTALLTLSGTLTDILAALDNSQLFAQDDGTLQITITASDGLATDNPIMNVVVNNVVPDVALPPGIGLGLTFFEGSNATIVATINDFDFDAVANTGVDLQWTVSRGATIISAGTGSIVNFYPANDGTFTLNITATDDDGGVSMLNQSIFVNNVAPTLALIDALPVNTLRTTFVTLNVVDPGTDDITVTYLWGDPVRPTETIVFVFSGSTMRVLGPISHEYIVAPNPAEPLAPIPITVIVSDGTSSVSQTFEVEVTGRGLPSGNPVPVPDVSEIRIAATNFNDARPEIDSVTQPVSQPIEADVVRDDGGESDPRKLVLRIVSADGESEDFTLPDEALADLPKYFRTKRFPDGHYRVYLLQGGTARLVIDSYIRQGKLVDPGDETDALADRPPAQDENAAPNATNGSKPGVDNDGKASPEGTTPDDTRSPRESDMMPGPRFQSSYGTGDAGSPIGRATDEASEQLVNDELLNEWDDQYAAESFSRVESRQAAIARSLLTGALMAGAVTSSMVATGRRSWAEQVDETLSTQRPALGKLARIRRRMTQTFTRGR